MSESGKPESGGVAGLDTSRLVFEPAAGRRLCDGLFLRARPGSITAILGPAGCGKSVFLKLLAGYHAPTRGWMQVRDRKLDRRAGAFRDLIGYVPQAEIMLPELTVRESLDYRLRLRFAGLGRAQRSQLIEKTCASLGLMDLPALLAKRIGSPEAHGAYPSGGERRRVNIAHELLAAPAVLLLDEPTSGLSSIDAENLARLLRELANEGLTVVMTIHQPSAGIFDLFNDLLVVGWGGTLAYYGSAHRAVAHFQSLSKVRFHPGQNPAAYVLDFVRHPEISAWSVQQFGARRAAWEREPLPEEP